MMKMTEISENRCYRRLELRMPFRYQKRYGGRSAVQHGVTENISTGGMYFQTANDRFDLGELLTIELDMSESEGYFPTHSTIETVAEVVRIQSMKDEDAVEMKNYGVGLRFCDQLKLNY